MSIDHVHFMELALAQAQKAWQLGNDPVGSVIVKSEKVVGIGLNLVHSTCDPTAHAESVAIRDACRKLQTTNLFDCICYTTEEPCPMCCWAIHKAGIDCLVLGARYSDLESEDVGSYSVETLLTLTGRQLNIVESIRAEECAAVRRRWLASKAR